MRSRLALALVALLALALGACESDDPGPLIVADAGAVDADYEYLIPDGTWDRINSGEAIEILPAQLDVRVGEVIRIVNEDSEGHFVGIFYVGAGETVTQRFSSAGEFQGQCTVHPSGEISLIVHE